MNSSPKATINLWIYPELEGTHKMNKKNSESTPLSQIKTCRTTKKISSRRCHTPVCSQMCLLLRALSPRKWCQWEDLLCFQPVTGPIADGSLLSPTCLHSLSFSRLNKPADRRLVSSGYSCSLRVSFKAATSQIFSDWLNTSQLPVPTPASCKLCPTMLLNVQGKNLSSHMVFSVWKVILTAGQKH